MMKININQKIQNILDTKITKLIKPINKIKNSTKTKMLIKIINMTKKLMILNKNMIQQITNIIKNHQKIKMIKIIQ